MRYLFILFLFLLNSVYAQVVCNMSGEGRKFIFYEFWTLGRGETITFALHRTHNHRKIVEVQQLGPNNEVIKSTDICEVSVTTIRRLVADVALKYFPTDLIVKHTVTTRKIRNLKSLHLQGIKAWVKKIVEPLRSQGDYLLQDFGWFRV